MNEWANLLLRFVLSDDDDDDHNGDDDDLKAGVGAVDLKSPVAVGLIKEENARIIF